MGIESMIILFFALIADLNEQKPAVKSDTNVYQISINNSKISDVRLSILPGDPKPFSCEIKQWKFPSLDSVSKTLVLAGSGAALWAAVLMKLMIGAYHAKRTDTWGAWKESIPEEILQEIPRDDLIHDLMMTIAKRYHIEEKDESNDLIIFAKFFHDIEEELLILQKYIRLHEWLFDHYLRKIFPSQEIALELAAQKVKRLVYLRSVISPRMMHRNALQRSRMHH